MTKQPFIDSWPMWDEPLSKIPVALDVAHARMRLARKFNRRLPKVVEVERAWRQHERQRGRRE